MEKIMFTDEYTQRAYDEVLRRNSHEPEFLQAVNEVFASVEPVIREHPEFRDAGVLERITEPERLVQFRVDHSSDETEVIGDGTKR